LLSAPDMVVCGQPAPIEQLCLVDRVALLAGLAGDTRTVAAVVDLSSPTPDLSFMEGADVVFHLAAAVSVDCERDFDLGMHSDVSATIRLLHRCRAEPEPALFVFASSVAVFGPGLVVMTRSRCRRAVTEPRSWSASI
jgi:D-erythronate 2-dehydrogenase